MKKQVNNYSTKLWLSARNTEDWARRPGASWPCSFVAGKSLFAEFDAHGDLIDMAVNGGRGNQDMPADEFNAITSDFLARNGN